MKYYKTKGWYVHKLRKLEINYYKKRKLESDQNDSGRDIIPLC
ncbi:TPA: DUF2639 domain-containing protein [Bacillus pseudomycoides]|nr:DUF2639 domain-containing protein [Bacillus pseudomycoides]